MNREEVGKRRSRLLRLDEVLERRLFTAISPRKLLSIKSYFLIRPEMVFLCDGKEYLGRPRVDN